MRGERRLLWGALCVGAAALSGCGEEAAAPVEAVEGPAVVVPPGKADNYFSTVGQEYTVTGQTFAIVEPGCGEEEGGDEAACARRAAGLKNYEIAWILNSYVIDKHDAANEKWGGFTAMTRPESFEALEASDVDAEGKFSYRFTSELSGPLDLLEEMPVEPCEGGDGLCFALEIPVLDSATLSQLDTGAEWYRRAPFNAYDPATYTGEKERLVLRIEAFPRSTDAFLEYNKLFDKAQLAKAGGQLRVGVFVGWDYYDGRYDLQTAKEVYRWLTQDEGFKSPVGSYDEYKIGSGDFTKTIRVQGEAVEVSVVLVHPGQGEPGSPAFAGQMKAEMIKAFGERQVIIYEGHAGPQYGFALGNWRQTEAGELDDSELPFLEVPEGFYQVVLASGCDTYMVADSLYQIPSKRGRVDLDVITTTSFSNAAGRGRTAKALMSAVFNQDQGGELSPQTYGALLRELNREWYMTPIYGVHGIDDNPRANPFADPTVLCQRCEVSADCGGQGSACVQLGQGAAVCGVTCKTDEDCPQEFGCFPIATGDTIHDAQCAPRSLTCQ